MRRVLMVCTGNTCRSVMAAGLLKKRAQEAGLDITVESAGLAAFVGDAATVPTENVMGEIGVDVRQHRSRRVQQPLLDEADIVFVMTEAHRQQLLTMFGWEYAPKVQLLQAYAGSLVQGAENTQMGQENTKRNSNKHTDMDISDPFGLPEEQYRQTAAAIDAAVSRITDVWREMEE